MRVRESDSCTRVVVYVRRARVQGKPVLCCLCCVPFSRTGRCVCHYVKARLRAHASTCPLYNLFQERRNRIELSPMRSGLAVRGVRSHGPASESLPCCIVDCGHATFLGSLILARSVSRPKEQINCERACSGQQCEKHDVPEAQHNWNRWYEL